MRSSLLLILIFSFGFSHAMKLDLDKKGFLQEIENFKGERFSRCEIRSADFRPADNNEYIIDYVELESGLIIYADDIDKAIFSLPESFSKKNSDYPAVIKQKEALKELKKKLPYAKGGCSGGG